MYIRIDSGKRLIEIQIEYIIIYILNGIQTEMLMIEDVFDFKNDLLLSCEYKFGKIFQI